MVSVAPLSYCFPPKHFSPFKRVLIVHPVYPIGNGEAAFLRCAFPGQVDSWDDRPLLQTQLVLAVSPETPETGLRIGSVLQEFSLAVGDQKDDPDPNFHFRSWFRHHHTILERRIH